MDISTSVFYVLCSLLNVLVMLNALTMISSINRCGKNLKLKTDESLFLKFDIVNSKIRKHGTNCTIKLSAPRNYNEICIHKGNTPMDSFYKLGECNNIFYIYLESHYSYNKNSNICSTSDVSSLCSHVNLAYMVFVYDKDFIFSERVSIALEIFAKRTRIKRGRSSHSTWSYWDSQKTRSSWSSWTSEYSDVDLSSYDLEDSDEDGDDDTYYHILPLFLLATCVFVAIFYCCSKIDCSEPVITANTQVRQHESRLSGNQFEGESAAQPPPENRENLLLTTSAQEDSENDPWKPPDYDSLATIDQSYYGELNRPRTVIEEPDPDIAADEDPPPPYPGVI